MNYRKNKIKSQNKKQSRTKQNKKPLGLENEKCLFVVFSVRKRVQNKPTM